MIFEKCCISVDLLDFITVDLDGGCLTVPENIKISRVGIYFIPSYSTVDLDQSPKSLT